MMTNETPLTKFIALVKFDCDHEKTTVRINELEKDIVLLQKKELEVDSILAAADNAVQELRKKINSYELAVKEFDLQIGNKKSKLESAMNPREYRAFISEIENLSVQQLAAEEHLLSSWSTLEQRKRFYDECSQSCAEQKKSIHASIAEKRNEIVAQKKVMSENNIIRIQYEQGIPEEWLTKYTSMRSRVTNPIVPVENDSCTACFYSMSEPELIKLRRRALLQCKGCYRFLYLPSVHQLP